VVAPGVEVNPQLGFGQVSLVLVVEEVEGFEV
jgi:hypothetical protein